MFKTVQLKIDEIFVPLDRRKEIDPQKVEETAEKIIEEAGSQGEGDLGEQPIQVRRGKDRYVLIKGVHRLEARKALGEETIAALIVDARQH